MMTDEELKPLFDKLRGTGAEKTKAFERIYKELSSPVYTAALRISRSRQSAEDITQEVFIKLFESPPDSSVSKPRAFVYRIAHNTAVDHIRKNHASEPLDDHENTLSSCIDEGASVVSEALSKLPSDQREIVTLHINAGLKFREIAQITDTPIGTVFWRYNKALSFLKDFLNS